MSQARYSIGVDLGTTNCALAYAPLGAKHAETRVLPIPQWDSATTLIERDTLPSFLYLPAEEELAQLRGKAKGGDWIVGRFARHQTTVNPARVVHSAKSWLTSAGVDRMSGFLPWGSDQISESTKISPVRASALLLNYLRDAWNEAHGDTPFDAQEITVAVPASFDAAAQRLTLDAAREAGFPDAIRLLEEPQAAFYRWLEAHEAGGALQDFLPKLPTRPHTILIVDVGGGTSDFSLFDIRVRKNRKLPVIKRIAVSDHILLGGDNIDLALAHIAEPQFGEQLSADQWSHLVAQCRRVKEDALASEIGAETVRDDFTLAVPGRGSGLLAGTLTAKLSLAEIRALLFDGFYPECEATVKPGRVAAGLREFGLAYATDSAITRHLAEFLTDRPKVDAVLFNGGSLQPERLRQRIAGQIARWQGGNAPVILENAEPALAVARGAASYGWLLQHQASRIEAGAARTLFLQVRRGEDDSLVCVLPKGTAQGKEIVLDDVDLSLVVNQPVQFQVFSSTRPDKFRAGQVVDADVADFHALPPLQTVANAADSDVSGQIPVKLSTRLNAVGLLQIECLRSDDPATRWPLEFNLRQETPKFESQASNFRSAVPDETLEAARSRISHLFGQPYNKRDKLTPARLLASLEKILTLPKHEWDAHLLRQLWATHADCFDWRYQSVDHEESWIALAGFLLRPGYGVALDETRIDQLWRLQEEEFWFPGKRLDMQAHVLWRRVSGGLSRKRQEALLAQCLPTIERQTKPSVEIVRLVGALERIAPESKRHIAELLLERGCTLGREGGYAEPYWVALTLLLNRAPTYAGPESVLPPAAVEAAFERVRDFDWQTQVHAALVPAFLRAARIVDNRALDLPKPLRSEILRKLKASAVPPVKLTPLETQVPVAKAEQASLFGEALPPGLVLG